MLLVFDPDVVGIAAQLLETGMRLGCPTAPSQNPGGFRRAGLPRPTLKQRRRSRAGRAAVLLGQYDDTLIVVLMRVHA